MSHCFLCGAEIGERNITKTDFEPFVYNIFCEECGAYKIAEIILMPQLSEEDKMAIIKCLGEKPAWMFDESGIILITENNIDYIRQEYKSA